MVGAGPDAPSREPRSSRRRCSRPAYTTPLFRKVPSVVAIHDVVLRGTSRLVPRARRHAPAMAVATGGAAFVGHHHHFEFSRRELVERFGVAESKIHVIPPGVTARGLHRHLERQPATVLFAGSIFNRRHVPHLVRAFALVAQRHPRRVSRSPATTGATRGRDLEQVIRHEGLEGGRVAIVGA